MRTVSLVTVFPNAHIHRDFRRLLCTDADFEGDCRVFYAPEGQCVELLGEFNENTSSIGPDEEQYCFFWLPVQLELPL